MPYHHLTPVERGQIQALFAQGRSRGSRSPRGSASRTPRPRRSTPSTWPSPPPGQDASW